MPSGTKSVQIKFKFKSLYLRLSREKHRKEPVFYHYITILLNDFCLIRRFEWNSQLYHLVSGYLHIKSIFFLYKCKTSKTPFGRDLNLYFGKGGTEVIIAYSLVIH